jgi:hypothetical protein
MVYVRQVSLHRLCRIIDIYDKTNFNLPLGFALGRLLLYDSLSPID